MAPHPRIILTTLALGVMILIGIGIGLWLIPQPVKPLSEIFVHGAMRVGMDISYPPFAFIENDELMGFEVDLARTLADAIGIPLQIVPLSYDGLYDALTSDRADVILSALLVDPTRMNDVRYTRHYFDSGIVLVSLPHQPFVTMEAVVGYRVAYEFGSEAENVARLWLRRIADFERLPYELPDHALKALNLGLADAVLVDMTSYLLYQRQNPTLEFEHVHITHAFYAAALRPDRLEAWQLIQDELWRMVSDGRLDALMQKWF